MKDFIRIRLPETGIAEQARFLERLERAGIPEEKIRIPEGSDKGMIAFGISRETADKYVKGGFERLLEVAKSSGDPDALDGYDLENLEPAFSARDLLLGAIGRDRRHAANKSIDMAVAALGQSLDALPNEPKAFVSEIRNLAVILRTALKHETLGACDRDRLDALNSAVESFHARHKGREYRIPVTHHYEKDLAKAIVFDVYPADVVPDFDPEQLYRDLLVLRDVPAAFNRYYMLPAVRRHDDHITVAF